MWLSRLLLLLVFVIGFVVLSVLVVYLIRRIFPAVLQVTEAGETNFDKAFTFVSLAWSLLFFVLVLNGPG